MTQASATPYTCEVLAPASLLPDPGGRTAYGGALPYLPQAPIV